MTEKRSSVNAEGVYQPFSAAAVPVESFARGERFGMAYRHLSSFGGATKVGVSLEELAPGRQANPSHYHLLEEEHLYLLEGTLTLLLGARSYAMQAGDYVCFPAGQKVGHAIRNDTDGPCRYLIFGNNDPHDVAVFPDTGRVAVRLMGEGYRQSATMEYWEGIDSGAP